jgi:eukaryotic-like serine/threonine-protein kinase
MALPQAARQQSGAFGGVRHHGVVAVPEHPPIPGYELLRLLGRNGHLVYLARQSSSGCLVYLNVVHSGGDFGRMVADGLRQQAALLAALDHPNIVRSVGIGDAPGHGFFSALEYADGGCLADKIRTGPLASTEAASIARAVASALQYAWARNAVQVDLNPRSILLARDGVPKLANFRPTGPGQGNHAGTGFTPSYAAPEEVTTSEDRESTPGADVYRVGAVLYAMLTTRPPFAQAGDLTTVIRQVLEQVPAPVHQRNPAVPPDLAAVCMKCLEKQPRLRYAGLGELMEALGKFMVHR